MGSYSEEIAKIIPIEADRLLLVWADFMKRSRFGTGYPKTSHGISTGGINCWDDVENEIESSTASAVNAVMTDLEARHYCVISNVYCAKVYSFRGNEFDVLSDAICQFMKKAKSRGLLCLT